MDPISATSVAAFAIQVVDFGAKVIFKLVELRGQAETVGNSDLRFITNDLLAACQSLDGSLDSTPGSAHATPSQAAIQGLGLECQKLGNELLAGLGKLKKREGQSKWASFRRAILSVWKDEEIANLERRIERCRQQLILRLLESLQEQFQRFEQKMGKESQQKMGQESQREIEMRLFHHLEKTQEALDTSTALIGGCLTEAIQLRVAKSKDTRQVPTEPMQDSLRRFFLQSLQFIEIGDRQNRILPAIQRTFEWIYRQPEPSCCQPWTSFVDWLENGEETYWITGKPGSGKSTLVKFLETDDRTKAHLKVWSGDHPLVMACFYFWNSGTELQMSITGLLRSLLYFVLKQRPELIPIVCPERWGALNLFGYTGCSQQWTLPELRGVFRRLPTAACSYLRFFFLIDGLDEFMGDHLELIEIIRELVACEHIKVCVASRPWVVFQQVFDKRPNFMLQHLTAPDIEIYVRDTFTANESFRHLKRRNQKWAKTFLLEIIERAEGVFLWVRLASLSLLHGISSGDKMLDLQKRLDEIPPDLEGLFWKILENLKPRYWQQATELFRIHRAHPSITALRMSFADEESDETWSDGKPAPLRMGEFDYRCYEIGQRINSRTMGMLELRRYQKNQGSENDNDTLVSVDKRNQANVQYLHRTVKDFIESEGMWCRITQASPEYDPHLSLCKAVVLEAKTWDDTASLSKHLRIFVKRALVYAAAAASHSHARLIPLLDSLEVLVATILRRKRYVWTGLDPDPPHGHSVLLPWAVELDLGFWVRHLLERGHPVEAPESRKSYLSFTVEPRITIIDEDGDHDELFKDGSTPHVVPLRRGDLRPVRMRCLKALLHYGASVYRRQNEEPLWKYICFEVAQSYKKLLHHSGSSDINNFNHWMDAAIVMKEYGADISLLSRLVPKPRVDIEVGRRLLDFLDVEDRNSAHALDSPRLARLNKRRRRTKQRWERIRRDRQRPSMRGT